MSEEMNPNAPEDFDADIMKLVEQLKAALGDGASRWYYDEPSETLYIELESLTHLSKEEAGQKAGPVLDSNDLDFEEIILLPYKH